MDFQKLGLRVKTLSATENPQIVAFAAAHQDYSELDVYSEIFYYDDGCNSLLGPCGFQDPVNSGRTLSESEAGLRIIKHCLNFSHFGPLEHPQIVVNAIGFPHTTMQQLRTHRTGISFDVQSGRYTGERIIKVANQELTPDKVFFVRPPGAYRDRFGAHIEWSNFDRECFLVDLMELSKKYAHAISRGMPKEMARDLYVPYCIRQDFVVSMNIRSAFHILDMRGKTDAELECQWFCDLLLSCLKEWAPQVTEWYTKTRYRKNKIAP